MGVISIQSTRADLERMRDDYASGKDIFPDDEFELRMNTATANWAALDIRRRAALYGGMPTPQERAALRDRAEKERQWKPRRVRGHR